MHGHSSGLLDALPCFAGAAAVVSATSAYACHVSLHPRPCPPPPPDPTPLLNSICCKNGPADQCDASTRGLTCVEVEADKFRCRCTGRIERRGCVAPVGALLLLPPPSCAARCRRVVSLCLRASRKLRRQPALPVLPCAGTKVWCDIIKQCIDDPTKSGDQCCPGSTDQCPTGTTCQGTGAGATCQPTCTGK